MSNLGSKSLEYALAIIFLSAGILMSACDIDFTPEFRSVTTSVSGRVQHKYLQYPMSGVMVKAYSYKNGVLSSSSEYLASTYTDPMGFFSMSFTHMDNAGALNSNNYFVYCPGFRSDSSRNIQPNASNNDILLFPYNLPILKLSFTVSNLTHPPLEINLPMNSTYFKYTNGDSIVYAGIGFDSVYKITYRYQDDNFDYHTKTAGFNPGNIFKDSFSYHVDIDASKF
jgi:hypothetical protein